MRVADADHGERFLDEEGGYYMIHVAYMHRRS